MSFLLPENQMSCDMLEIWYPAFEELSRYQAILSDQIKACIETHEDSF